MADRASAGSGRIAISRRKPSCSASSGGSIRTLHTPVGSLVEERIIQPTYTVEGFRKHFVEEPKDYEVLLYFFRDGTVFDCYEELREVTRAWATTGCRTRSWSPPPISSSGRGGCR